MELVSDLNNIKAETFMLATAFNLRSLYQAWHRRLNKTWKAGYAGIATFLSGPFLAFIGYCNVDISDYMAETC